MRRQSSGTWGGRDITKRVVRKKEEAMVTGCDAQRTVDVHAKRAAPEIALSSRGPQRSAPSAHQARVHQESFVRHALKIMTASAQDARNPNQIIYTGQHREYHTTITIVNGAVMMAISCNWASARLK